jgi:hypothetical protein
MGALLFCAVLVGRRATAEERRALAASGLLTAACYGIIVLGRVVFFTAYPSATMAMQPRYHYAGLLPLTILLCVLLGHAGRRLRLPAWAKTSLVVAWLTLVASTYAWSDFVIDHHAKAKKQTDEVLATIRARVAAQPPGTEVSIPNRGFAAFPGGVPRPAFPGWAAVFVVFHPENTVDGRRVRFIDADLGVNVASVRGKRSKGLIVPP